MNAAKKWAIVTGLLISFSVTSGYAYDAETHALIAYKAYGASALSQTGVGSLVTRLGLDRFDPPLPFNAYWQATGSAPGPVSYYDNTTTFDPAAFARQPEEYERCQMQHLADFSPSWYVAGEPMLNGSTVAFFPIQNWLMRGDLREDDITPLGYRFAPEKCVLPEVDPNPDQGITRVMHHFYDPIHDVALTSGCAVFGYNGVCSKSIDWALGYVDSFATPPVINTSRRNHFTYADARENMWRALTAQHGRPTPPYTAKLRADDAQERLYRWATTFRSLGDVIHLLQDGAQPQHVRNDAHSPFTSGERQAYEGYTNARVVGTGVANVNSYVREFFAQPQQVTVPLIVTSPYPTPALPFVMFSTPVRFFSTRLKADGPTVSPKTRYGLMDYTNRGFFTGGTLPGGAGNSFQEPPPTIDATYSSISQPCVLGASVSSTVTNLTCSHLMHSVLDLVAPTYQDELPHKAGSASLFTAPPVLLVSAFKDVVPGSLIPRPHQGYSVGLEEFQTMANLAIPRAISYSAGLLNYFFRGQLAVTAPPDRIVGVLNQGAQHTMNAQGYPCVGTSTADGCPIFGFQSIRVSVQNTTPQITESGTAAQIPQKVSDTSAGDPTDPNFHGPYLIAVAKYHRNTCYKPDLSGERVQIYAPIPQLLINDPTCTAGQTVRTAYQEISVSKSAAVTGTLLNGTTSTEVHFDFSSDPIPVNATDLFIQVVYRGPMGDATLGLEPDAIAVGTFDVREPTFPAFWNNTDNWWDESNWQPHNGTYPNDSAEYFQVCAGTSPVKLVFDYQGAPGAPAMDDPIVSSNHPGVVRMGLIFPPPDPGSPTQRKVVRGTPVAYVVPGEPQIPVRSAFTAGTFRQANVENLPAATLSAAKSNCTSGLPTGVPYYWCFDPIQQRRGQRLGDPAQPMYLEPIGGGNPPTDVDAVPLSTFAGITPLASGTIRFDTDTTLQTCPSQPTSILQPVDKNHVRLIELQEEAAGLGIDEN